MLQELTIAYLTSRSNFVQISPEIPITKQINPEKYDPPEVFEGRAALRVITFCLIQGMVANKKKLVTDLIVKAKQVEYLIKSLPEPEPEEDHLCAKRLQALDDEMTLANEEYIQAVARSKDLHAQITDTLRLMLEETETGLAEKPR
ncbi:hypothetical protein B0H16DRAFT_1668008 [Mycena metata]|uniref:Mediator of RNA polymerase II transcription subunit 21 n=1 Tax=Mycena metata TaxID=1033252 RepID=A0AAD7GZ98_9AGAR|nr:hypothetical protein B0H16DRAFT_1668008 [Mycena metata]